MWTGRAGAADLPTAHHAHALQCTASMTSSANGSALIGHADDGRAHARMSRDALSSCGHAIEISRTLYSSLAAASPPQVRSATHGIRAHKRQCSTAHQAAAQRNGVRRAAPPPRARGRAPGTSSRVAHPKEAKRAGDRGD